MTVRRSLPLMCAVYGISEVLSGPEERPSNGNRSGGSTVMRRAELQVCFFAINQFPPQPRCLLAGPAIGRRVHLIDTLAVYCSLADAQPLHVKSRQQKVTYLAFHEISLVQHRPARLQVRSCILHFGSSTSLQTPEHRHRLLLYNWNLYILAYGGVHI